MAEANTTPDAPFRSGSTGKYKLQIKEVTPKISNYEYDLVDADGKEYKAFSEYHYAEGQILRCMVSFEVVNARLVVSSTVLCKKQDLATLIPETKKPKPKIKTPPESEALPRVKQRADHLGNPRARRVSGLYILRIVDIVPDKPRYTYWVEDAKGQTYEAWSDKQYPIGKKVSCYVNVSLTPGGVLKICVTSMGKPAVAAATSKRKKLHKKYHFNPSFSQSSWPEPAAGDHLHIIYTPMGNKR